MKKKIDIKIVAIIVVVAVAISVVATIAITNNKQEKAKQNTTANSTITGGNSTNGDSLPTIVETSIQDVTEAADSNDTTASQNASFESSDWWYYFDESNRDCYAFRFGKDMNMEVAYFSNKNIDVGDAKYFTGTSTYSIEGNTIRIKYLPDALPTKSFDLTIEKNKLLNGSVELQPHEELSLDYPVGYYMLIDGMVELNNQ